MKIAEFEDLLRVQRLTNDPKMTPDDVKIARKSLDRRRTLLHTVLGYLRGRAHFGQLHEILERAKRQEWLNYLAGHDIDQRRQFEEDRKEVEKALRVVNRVRAKWRGGNDPEWSKIEKPLTDNMTKVEWSDGPVRRPRAGHQAQPWLSEARQRLAELKISKELREDLLVAVGLSHSTKYERSRDR